MTARRLLLSISLLVPSAVLLAQDRADPPPAPAVRAQAEVAPPGSLRPVSLRDPFRGSPALEGGPRGPTPLGGEPVPAGALPPLQLRLLGLLRVKGRAPGALLELGDERCVVRAGDRLHLQRGPLPVVVEVQGVGQGVVQLLIDGREREVR